MLLLYYSFSDVTVLCGTRPEQKRLYDSPYVFDQLVSDWARDLYPRKISRPRNIVETVHVTEKSNLGHANSPFMFSCKNKKKIIFKHENVPIEFEQFKN